MQSASHKLPNTQLCNETEPYDYGNDKFSQDCDPDFTQLESMFAMVEVRYVRWRTLVGKNVLKMRPVLPCPRGCTTKSCGTIAHRSRPRVSKSLQGSGKYTRSRSLHFLSWWGTRAHWRWRRGEAITLQWACGVLFRSFRTIWKDSGPGSSYTSP